jgi:pyrroloquinoline quinone biosynthesis protein D
MNAAPSFALTDVIEIAKHYRLQWEPVPQAYVLLYPEGRVQLNPSAGEIFKRLDGKATIATIIDELQAAFNEPDLRNPVLDALALARQQGWIRIKSPGASA